MNDITVSAQSFIGIGLKNVSVKKMVKTNPHVAVCCGTPSKSHIFGLPQIKPNSL